ncbi:presenilins-associated rhomboid-like protein, mitochondrial isoform X4 [Bufo gargarizans]|uniref:presenilins-associated rhomboid-like protein, mitochondrial isoform X4 n=1 Tax=Bufo gargarizans TaxID=30331 RepID=UPI001CF20F45|nr:presenilins-associated rhomboid-like protein, mitochondrial isoform X4 [Bufo gargarizans]XP_044144182.1 presenilins-associated rhomboid-like protein, mitochondrial isoform X4 [Bufo gargarizans]
MNSACWIVSSCTRTRLCHGQRVFIEQRRWFRKVSRKTERAETEAWRHNGSRNPIAESAHFSRIRILKKMYKPFLFTVGFSGCSFGAAAIWQYESLKNRMKNYLDDVRADWLEKLRPAKHGDFRKQVNEWYNSLNDGQKTVSGIIAANLLVFCLWRVPNIQRTMFRYFTSNPASQNLCFPMILSTFSHFSLFHMAANMYVLWTFSSSIVSILGQEQFLALYMSAGVVSTFASYVCKAGTGRFGPSLGAVVWSNHDNPCHGVYQDAGSQTCPHFPTYVYIYSRKCSQGYPCFGFYGFGTGLEVF